MKIRAWIFANNPEALENQKIDLIESAYPVSLSFNEIQTRIDPIKENPYYVLPFVYEVPTEYLDNLIYFFTDFVTCVARLHCIKVWFGSFEEVENG